MNGAILKTIPVFYMPESMLERNLTVETCGLSFEPGCEKTGLREFRPGPTQTGLYSHRRWLEA